MHGGQEASRPRSPVSGTLINPDAVLSLPTNHAAVVFMRDHQSYLPDPLGHQDIEPPNSCATDDTVADAPTPLLPTKVKHFAASPGLHAK